MEKSVKVDEDVWEQLKAKVGYDGCTSMNEVIKLLLKKEKEQNNENVDD